MTLSTFYFINPPAKAKKRRIRLLNADFAVVDDVDAGGEACGGFGGVYGFANEHAGDGVDVDEACLALDAVYAPVAGVADAVAGIFQIEAQGGALSRVHEAVGLLHHGAVALAAPIVERAVFERAVADQLGIDAAVAGVVDFLIENAVVEVADTRAAVGGVDGKLHLG